MNNKHLLDPDLFANPTEWPRCPRCGSRDALVTNTRQYCLSCPERTPLATMRGQVGPHLLAVSLLQIPQQESPAVQFGPFPQHADPEFGHILHYRRVEALLDDVLDPIVEKARTYHGQHQSFPTAGLSFQTLASKPEFVDRAAGDIPSTSEKRDACADLVLCAGMDRALCVELECYGHPGLNRNYHLSDLKEYDSVREVRARSIYQPLHWPLFCVDPKHETLHYAAALEARGTSNACLAVTESLDSGEVVFHQVLRQPGDPAVVSQRQKAFDSTDEAVAHAKKRFKKLTDLIECDSQVFSFEREFGLERNFMGVLGELMGMEIWEVYRNERHADNH